MSTFRKALVAVDLEETSARHVLESTLALVPREQLSVVHVVERAHFYNLGDASYPAIDDLHTRMMEEIRVYLERLCGAYDIPEHLLLEGRPAALIQQHAEDHGHDLIALGTHGRHGIRRLLGSTANAVLHGTGCNVLAVRVPGGEVEVRPARDKYRHILAAVDLSNDSHQVLDMAEALSASEQAELKVLHVIKPFHQAYAGITPATVSDVGLRFEEDVEKQARAQMKTMSASRGLPADAMLIRHGAPHLQIQDAVDELATDLLVVGTHGKDGLELLLGSVANAVLHGITCDVLAVRIR